MLIINNKYELKNFLSSENSSKIEIHYLKTDTLNKYFSFKINKLKNTCGCDTGAIFTGFSILVCVFLKFSKFKILVNIFGKNEFLYFLLFIIAFSLIGKIVGIISAKVKLKLIQAQIERLSLI